MINKNSVFLALVIIMISAKNINAQEAKGLLNRTPEFLRIESPNVASFNKYIDNPINLYNGTPNVDIPLYTLKDGAIELPISLRYNTSGIKVDEEASWVGLGWNLNMGGIIVQNIVGEYDFRDTEYDKIINMLSLQNNIIYGYSSPNYTNELHKAFMPYIEYGNIHSGKLNPDVYYFSYPEGNGKFIIDHRTGKIHILNREKEIKIEITEHNPPSSSQAIKAFKITTLEGVQHIFNYSFVVNNISKPLSPISSISYLLMSSKYPNGQIVTYNYETYPIRKFYRDDFCYSAMKYNNIIQGDDGGDIYIGNQTSIQDGKEYYLKNIETSNYKITFNIDDRLDLMYGKKLNSIIISPKNQNSVYTKEYNFSYDYFQTSDNSNVWTTPFYGPNEPGYDPKLKWDVTNHGGKRLKLLNIYQKKDNKISDKYSFIYNTTGLPNKKSFAVDYWGYYNKAGNKSFLPKIQDMAWGSVLLKQEEYSIEESFKSYGNRYRDETSDRRVNPSVLNACMLEGIVYPTGGLTEFISEPNQFRGLPIPSIGENVPYPPSFKTYDVRDVNGSLPTYVQFTIDKRIQAELIVTSGKGLNEWSGLIGSNVSLVYKEPSGGYKPIIYEALAYPSGQNPNDGIRTMKYDIWLEVGDYQLQANLPDALGNQDGASTKHGYVTAQLKHPIPVIVPERDVNACGLRIKDIKLYDNIYKTNLQEHTEYKYVDPKTGYSSGVLHEILKNAAQNNTTFYAFKTGKAEVDLKILRMSTVHLSGNNPASNPYGSTAGIGYSIVEEIRTQSGNGSISDTTIYNYYNEDPSYSRGSMRIDKPLNGKLIEKQIIDGTNKITHKEKYNYEAKQTLAYFGINFQDNLNLYPDIYRNVSNSLTTPPDNNLHIYQPGNCYRMSILIHALNVFDITLKEKESTIDGIVKKENYLYDNQTLLLKEKSISMESNNIMKYSYFYPKDYNCDVFPQMVSLNLYSRIIEEKMFKNGEYIGGMVKNYKLTPDNKMILPSKFYFSENTSKLTNPRTFDCTGINTTLYPYVNVEYLVYDDFGNVISMVHNDNTKVVYLWSYNGQFPVAEIRNATYAQVRAALGNYSPESLSKLQIPDMDLINGLRTKENLKDAHITTYVYEPLVGIIQSTDPSGNSIYYEYDLFGRLKEQYIYEKDELGKDIKKIIQVYDYHYYNQ